MQRYSWHLQFLQSFQGLGSLSFDEYRALVMRPASRRLWGGSVQYFQAAVHPRTGTAGVIVFLLYAEPGTLEVDAVAEAQARLVECMPFARELLVFVPELPDQETFVMREQAALEERGVYVLSAKEL